MTRLLRISSVLGAVLALSACVAPGYGHGQSYYGGGGGYRNYAYAQPNYGFNRGGGWGGGGWNRGGWGGGGWGGGHRHGGWR